MAKSANILIEARGSESVPDEKIEFDKPDSLEARYAEIFRLWQHRHKLEEESRESAYNFLHTWAKAYSTNKTHLDFDRILGGFDTQNAKQQPVHISDILYNRYLEFKDLDPNKYSVTSIESELLIKDDRYVYSLTPTKVEMQRAKDTDQPIELTWAQAFAMADDALANSRMLPPNTMRLQGSAGNRIKLEAALKIRSEGWPKEHMPMIENAVGAFKAFNPASYGLSKHDQDPYGVLEEARRFVKHAYKKGEAPIPPGLAEGLGPLRENIDEYKQRMDAENGLSGENTPAENQDAKLTPDILEGTEKITPAREITTEDILAQGNTDPYEVEAYALSPYVVSVEVGEVPNDELSAQGHIDNAVRALNELSGYAPEETVDARQEEITDPLARYVAKWEEYLSNQPQEELAAYGNLNDENRIYSYVSKNDPQRNIFFVRENDGNALVLEIRENGQSIYLDNDPAVQDELALLHSIRDTNEFCEAKQLEVAEHLERQRLSEENAEEDSALDPEIIAAAQKIMMAAQEAEASRTNGDAPMEPPAIPDWYDTVRMMMTSFPKDFQGIKTDKLAETVNLAIQRVQPDATLLPEGSNDQLLELLKADNLIQIKDYKSGTKIAKVASFNNYDPAYKEIVQEVVNNRSLLVGKNYSDFESMVKELRKSGDADDMGEFSAGIAWKAWKHLRTDGVIACSDASKNARILDVADGLKHNPRFRLTSEFSKAAAYLKEAASTVDLEEEKEKKAKKKDQGQRSPLAEEMDRASVPVTFKPLIPAHSSWVPPQSMHAAVK